MRTRSTAYWAPLVSAFVLVVVAAWIAGQWPERGFWYDETVNAYFAERGLSAIWEWCARIDNQMPLDFVLRMGWGRFAGTSEFALRAYSVGFALLSVAGVIALGRRVGRAPLAGWIAGGAYALTQSFLYAAFEVRPYALALAVFAWSCVVLWELWTRYADGVRRLDRHYVLLLGLYWALALGTIYTHYTGVLALGAHGVFVGVAALRQATRRRWTIVAHLGLGLVAGYAPWLVALAGRDIRAGTAYEAQIVPLQALETYVAFYAHGQRNLIEGTPPYAWVAAFLVSSTGVLALALNRRRFDRMRGAWFALSITLVPLAGLLVMVYAVQAKLSGRHGWPVWIGAALLIGAGIAALDRLRYVRWLAILVALAIVWLPGRADLPLTYNSYLREAFAYINAHALPGDVLVLRDGTLFTAAEYYDVEVPWVGLPPEKITDVNRFLFIDEALQRLDSMVRAHDARRVWVLSWQGEIMDPQDIVDGILELIGEPQPLEDAYGFGDVSLLLYTLHDAPDAVQARVEAMSPVVETPNGGPLYYGGYVLNKTPVPHGGIVLLHTWWQRGAVVMPDMRVSVRLYDATGHFYAQQDQPPVNPSFGQEHWQPGELVLSRFALWVPPNMPDGPAEVKLLIYHMQGMFDPITVPVGTFEVRD